MRVLIFHGYLLAGTGSNVYNARLAAALVRLGHDVHLLCQERHPERQPFVARAGDWDEGALRVRELDAGGEAALAPGGEGEPGGRAEAESEAAAGVRARDGGCEAGSCTVYRPDIGGLLPVYVADRYEGVRACTFAQCSDDQLSRYVEANVAAVREVRELVRPHAALANHLVMGPAILARALRGEVPYAVKVHGSALEYTVKPQPERFLPYAREGLRDARGVLVGSRHTAESLWRALQAPPWLVARTRLGPPGVDVQRFAPREPHEAARALRALPARVRALDAAQARAQPAPASTPAAALDAAQARAQPAPVPAPTAARDAAKREGEGDAAEREGEGGAAEREGEGGAFARDADAVAGALARLGEEGEQLVAYVGKLIVSKGVDLLLAAWPLVLARVPRARLAIVGFGAYRVGLESLCAALAAGDLAGARELALAGRAIEDASSARRPLAHLLAFLDALEGDERERYLAAARALSERVVFCGRLEHDELAELLPACDALVVPSTFPEAFGMVAAEAAACGALPVSAAHSGLAEVSAALAQAVPAPAARWLSFALGEDAVLALAGNVAGWLLAERALRERTRGALVATVRRRWSWEGVAQTVIAAAHGELDALPSP